MRLKLVLTVLALSSFALAQHGPGGHGGGASMGGGSSMSQGHSSMGSDMSSNRGQGQGQMGQSSQGRTPSDILSQNTKLSSNLEKLLPPGTTAQQACSGFKNLGQCVAAIHVSHNLDIPFANLKAKMTGTGSESLGKALKDLKPSADAKAESKKAQQQADQDMKG